MVSVRRCEPRRRASAAGIACSKRSRHAHRDLTAIVPTRHRDQRWHVCRKAAASSCQFALSKSAARKSRTRPDTVIDAGHERLPVLILAREVPANDVVGHRRTAGAGTRRTLSGPTRSSMPARSPTLPVFDSRAARVDVLSAAKQRAEEANLRLGEIAD